MCSSKEHKGQKRCVRGRDDVRRAEITRGGRTRVGEGGDNAWGAYTGARWAETARE
jgi:hypothetical protein